MQVIVFNVKHSRLVRYTSGVIASDSYEHLQFQFNFKTDDWASVSIKTANFQYAGKTYPVELDENNQVLVPAAVLNAPAFKVSIFGGGMTTQSVKIPVQDCGIGDPGTDPEPDEYFGEVINKITAMVDAKADALVFNEEDKTIQLASNGKPICDKVPVDVDGIDRCYINDDANLIVCLQDGSTINVGQVVDTHGNNYTLASNGAEANIIEVVKVNGTALPVVNKTVDVTVPTGAMASKDNVSKDDLTNDLKVEIEGKLDASKVTGDMLTHNASEFALAEHSHKIPTSTSELTNDSGFITNNDLPDVPTKTSELANDSGFITVDDISGKANQSYVDDKLAKKVDTVTYNADKANFALKSELYDDTVLAGKVAAIEDDYLKAADKSALQDQITTNANAITLLTDGVDASKVDGVKDLIDYVDKHGAEVTGIKKDIATNAAAIAEKADADHSHSEYATLDENGKVSEDQLPEIPAQNALIATSVEEMDALLVDENVGKLVTYLGESGGSGAVGLVGTPFEVGDEISMFYMNKDAMVDFKQLDYSNVGAYEFSTNLLEWAEKMPILSAYDMDMSVLTSGQLNGHIYAIGIGYGGSYAYLWSDDIKIEDVTELAEAYGITEWGWLPSFKSTLEEMNWVLPSSMFSGEETLTITGVHQQDLWSTFLSKTPFVEGSGSGGGYDKNSVYSITKTDSGEIVAQPITVEIPEMPDIPEQNALIAKTEDEMNALLIAENVGKTISYNDVLYMVVNDGENIVVKEVDVKISNVTVNGTNIEFTMTNGESISAELEYAEALPIEPGDLDYAILTNKPIEIVDTAEELEALLVSENNGVIISYIGEDGGVYAKNTLYTVVENQNGDFIAQPVSPETAGNSEKLDGQDGSYYLDYNNFMNIPEIPEIPEVPTKTSELTNDSGFITRTDIPTIPTTTSQLQNNSGFVTEDTLSEAIGNKADKDEIITDYNGLSNRPIINANLIGTSNPTTGVYYRHVGSTNDTYTKGIIYYYDGEAYHPMAASIPLAEKGQPNGVAELNESGIVPTSQLPTIPTTTAQLQNNSGYVTETVVDQKLANLVGASKEELDTLEELGKALEAHADEYDALLQQVSSKASTEYVDTEIKEKGAFFIAKDKFAVIAGTATLSMRWNVNDVDGITEPFPGMAIRVQIPDTFVYSSNTVLSIDGGITYHPVLRNKITALTNAYQEDVIVTFIYNDLSFARVYLENRVQTTITGCWQVADYDSDRLVQQNRSSSDSELPVLLKINSNNENTTGNAYFASDVTVNPKTGAVNAKEFYEDGVSLAEKYGGNEGGMPIIRLVKVSDMNRTGVVSPTNPIRVTIQVLSGSILPTDTIELCSRKSFTYKLYDESPDATRKKGRRWRLRKIAEKLAEVCHPDKSFPSGMYRMICWDVGDIYTPREFLRSDNVYTARKWVTKYVRVSRMDAEGTIYHSNAVAFSFSIDNLLKPEKHTAKIHIN